MSKEFLKAFLGEAQDRASLDKPPPKRERAKAKSKGSRSNWLPKRTEADEAFAAHLRSLPPLTLEEFQRLIEEGREEWENW